MDQYRTVKNEAEDEFVERRSRFIGRVKPVKTEEDAVDVYKRQSQDMCFPVPPAFPLM